MNKEDYENLREITGAHAIAPAPRVREDSNVAFVEINLDRANLLEYELLNDLNEAGYMHRANRKDRPSGMQLQYLGRYTTQLGVSMLFEDINA